MEQTTISSENLKYHISKKTAAQLSHAHLRVTKGNQDRVYIIDGREGSGKSTLAIQLAYATDPTFCLDRIVFNSADFAKAIRSTGKHKAIIFDEAFNGLSSKAALSKENKELVSLLQECRQANLFIFIVLPSIFLLEKYVGIFRSQALFHVYEPKNYLNRRFYITFNYANKKKLYLLGKPLMAYNRPYIKDKNQYFNKFPVTIDEMEYRKKKHDAFTNRPKEIRKTHRWEQQRDILIKYLCKNYKCKQTILSSHLGEMGYPLDQAQISRIVSGATQI